MGLLNDLTCKYSINLKASVNKSIDELKETYSMTQEDAESLWVIIQEFYSELKKTHNGKQLSKISDVVEEFRFLGLLPTEELWVGYLDVKNRLISKCNIVQGDCAGCQVPVRKIIETAFKVNANKMLMVHNHPSGDVTASSEDINLTQALKTIGRHIDIELVDSIIIANDDCRSIIY